MVLMLGPVFDFSGYASALRSIISILVGLGCEVRITPNYDWCKAGPKLLKVEFDSLNSLVNKKPTLDSVKAIYQVQMNILPDFAGKKIVHTMFETDRCPQEWVSGLNLADDVLVPSEFGVDAFRSSGVKNVRCMPFPINTDLFSPNTSKLIDHDSRFKFMYFGDQSSRKNVSFLVQAYLNVFANRDDVVLILKILTDRNKLEKEILALSNLRNKSLGGNRLPEILIYPDMIPDYMIPGFINSCDCYVSPSHGEGFGLPALQAMACEKLVISIPWSACADYIDVHCALPLSYEVGPVSYAVVKDNQNFYGHQWANPSYEHLVNLMQYVVDNRDSLQGIRKAARKKVVEKYSIPVVSGLMKNFLKERKLL